MFDFELIINSYHWFLWLTFEKTSFSIIRPVFLCSQTWFSNWRSSARLSGSFYKLYNITLTNFLKNQTTRLTYPFLQGCSEGSLLTTYPDRCILQILNISSCMGSADSWQAHTEQVQSSKCQFWMSGDPLLTRDSWIVNGVHVSSRSTVSWGLKNLVFKLFEDTEIGNFDFAFGVE